MLRRVEKMAKKNLNLQDDEKLADGVQKYKCLYLKSDNGYKERDRVAKIWTVVEVKFVIKSV